jgi:phage recombination protein Bet
MQGVYMNNQVIKDNFEKGKEKNMSLALHAPKVVAMDFSDDKVQLLKNTVCKGATNDELQLFLHVCSRTGLDPFRNQIYAIKRNTKEGARMTIQTGIDGFRLVAERTERYAPGKEPTYEYDAQGKLVSATSYIKKQTPDGTWHEVSAKAHWSEYAQVFNGKPSQFWAKMPHVMLAKCAEAIALRKAFPADFSGIYTTEEMTQADSSNVVNTPTQENSDIVNISTVEMTGQIVEKDLTMEELDAYIQQEWMAYHSIFKEWVESWRKDFTYKKCVETVERNKEKTRKSLDVWLCNKVGI